MLRATLALMLLAALGLASAADAQTRQDFATGLDTPWQLLQLADGRVLVSERNAGRVSVISDGSANPTARADFATGLDSPGGLVQLTDGRVLVAEFGAGRVSVISDAAGAAAPRSDFATGLDRPVDLVQLTDGRVLVAEDNSFGRVSVISDESGTPTARADFVIETLFPNSIAQLADGRVLVVNLRVEVVSDQGGNPTAPRIYSSGGRSPWGIEQLADGRVLVSDRSEDRIVVISDDDGDPLSTPRDLVTGLDNPRGLLLLADGRLLVAEPFGQNRVSAIDLGDDAEGSTEIQIVHDAAALAGDGPFSSYGPIEFYVDGADTPAATLEYGEASSYVPAPTGRAFEIRARPVAPPPDPLPRELSFPVTALPTGRYVVSFMGIPEEILSLYPRQYFRVRIAHVINGVSYPRRTARPPAADASVTLFHAVADAGPLDLRVKETGALLVSALEAGSGATATLAPGTYTLDATLAGQTDVLVSQTVVVAPGDGSLAVSVRGFLDPAANLDGPPLEIGAANGTGAPALPTAGEDPPGGVAVLDLAPNPARDVTRVTVSTEASGWVRVVVVDALGREVARVHDGPLGAGAHEMRVSTAGLASGAYFVRLTSEAHRAARPLTVVR